MARTVRKSGMREVPLSEIKDDLSRFLREAETQEIVITRNGCFTCGQNLARTPA
jgi:Antitoxin Phd_YefM, type II toxin-antitoxin system